MLMGMLMSLVTGEFAFFVKLYYFTLCVQCLDLVSFFMNVAVLEVASKRIVHFVLLY